MASLWSQKFCITEFYVRLTEHFREEANDWALKFMRWGLLATFLAAVVSVFEECRPGHKSVAVPPTCKILGLKISNLSSG
jgi:hypothetical protein